MEEDFKTLVNDVRTTFETGRTRDVEWRKSQLRACEKMLTEHEATFIEALKQDLNKPLQDAIVSEIDFLKNEVISLLRNIDSWSKDQYVPKSPITLLDSVSQCPEPYGVVLVIGAWNFPLHLSMAPALPALAAGNCVIIKPSEISPATSKVLAELVPKYMDKKCVRVVEGGVKETTELLRERFDYIFYTGSTPVGKIIGAAANVHLTPCTLELGGKSPTFVDDSGNMEVKVKRLLWGKFSNSGQICVAPDYVLCTKTVESQMVPIMKKVLKEWFGENPEMSKDYCRIVSSRHLERLSGLLKQTKGTIVVGGKSDLDTKFMEPTIVTGVDWQDALMKDEIFGPILPILTVASAEEAIRAINKRDKPLALYVFSDKKEVQEEFKMKTSSGGLLINDTILHLSVEELPFGGVGASGMGAYHGKHGFDTFTHSKPVLTRDLGWLGEKLAEFRYPPYNSKDIGKIRNLVKNRTLPHLGWLKSVSIFAVGASLGYALSLAI